jgi:hypothetical protein
VHNYERIVTNPKDKKLDVESCGSFYLKDWELGNDEIAIRDTIKKSENRKIKMERRRKKQALKKDGEENKTDGDGGSSTNPE